MRDKWRLVRWALIAFLFVSTLNTAFPPIGGSPVHERIVDSLSGRAATIAGAIKSVQRGVITLSMGVGSNTATITSVDTSKSMIFYLGVAGDATATNNIEARVALTNATTVTATRDGTTNSSGVGYQVVEFF